MLDLEGFYSWTEARGLRVSSTRLRSYIDEFGNYDTKTTFADLEIEGANRFIFLLREVDELLWIYSGLKVAEPLGAGAVLEKALGGTDLAREEKPTAAARNFQFELRIASYFLHAGFWVDLSTETDLRVQLSNSMLHVECKRVSSPKKIRYRAKEALKQLRRRMVSDKSKMNVYGLPAIDLSRALHPEQGMASAWNHQNVRTGLQQQLLRVDDRHNFGEIFGRDKNVLSVWLQLSAPTVSVEGPATRFSSLHIPLAPKSGPRAKAFEELRRVFEWEGA